MGTRKPHSLPRERVWQVPAMRLFIFHSLGGAQIPNDARIDLSNVHPARGGRMEVAAVCIRVQLVGAALKLQLLGSCYVIKR